MAPKKTPGTPVAGGATSQPATTLDRRLSIAWHALQLPEHERDAFTKAALADNNLYMAGPHERNVKRLDIWDENSVREFNGSHDEYYSHNGRQDIWSRMGKYGRSGFIMAMAGLLGTPFDPSAYTEVQLLKLIEEFFSGKSRPLQLQNAVAKIAQPGKIFNPKAHSNYLGIFHSITTSEFPDVWNAMEKKAQLDLLMSGFSTEFKDTCKETLQAKVHGDYWAGIALIAIEEIDFTTRIDLDARQAKREAAKHPTLIPPKVPADQIQVNLARNLHPCANCGPGRGNSHEIAYCKYICQHPSHTSDQSEPHLAANGCGKTLCKAWISTPSKPKQAMMLTVDDASDEEDDAVEEERSGRHFANMMRTMRVYPSDDEESDDDTDCPEGVPN